MEYQFVRSPFNQPEAEFTMGAEALGKWFTDELGNDQSKIAVLLETIEQLERRQLKDFRLNGAESAMYLDQYEVEVYPLQEMEPDAEAPEGTEFNDQQLRAGCGLEDFKQALLSWQEFTK